MHRTLEAALTKPGHSCRRAALHRRPGIRPRSGLGRRHAARRRRAPAAAQRLAALLLHAAGHEVARTCLPPAGAIPRGAGPRARPPAAVLLWRAAPPVIGVSLASRVALPPTPIAPVLSARALPRVAPPPRRRAPRLLPLPAPLALPARRRGRSPWPLPFGLPLCWRHAATAAAAPLHASGQRSGACAVLPLSPRACSRRGLGDSPFQWRLVHSLNVFPRCSRHLHPSIAPTMHSFVCAL